MTTKVDPLDFCDVTLRMDSLATAIGIQYAFELIAWCVEDWTLWNNEGTTKVGRTFNVTLSDSGPYLVRFILGRHTDVFIAIEVLAVLGGDSQRTQKSCDTKVEHSINVRFLIL